jgi:hypothetical protein
MTVALHHLGLPPPQAAHRSVTPIPSPSLTLADVLAALPSAGDVTPRRRQDMASAVRTVARLLEEDPARIPANRRALARRLDRVAPAAHGIGKPTWANHRSLLNAALDLVLPPHLRRRRNLPLEPEWRRLQERVADQWARRNLSRFFRFCGEAGIGPTEVAEATLEGFAAYLDGVLLMNRPGFAGGRWA